MARSGVKFGRKREEAIAALLTQRNVEEAARAAGIGTRTLLRWLKIPEFDAAYRQARRAAFGQTIARLQQGSPAAATTLMKLMLDAATPPSTRARCSESIISFASKAIELEDIEARVAELERATGGSKPPS
jgi:transposase-like protein